MEFTHYYARQLCLPEVGAIGQEKLLRGKCLIVGAGGLGCAALYYLAAAGVGTLGICDGDCVEISNLHRQILYDLKQIGGFKAECAKERIQNLNPFVKVSIIDERLTALNCAQILSKYDIVLDCSDNFETKFLLNDSSFLLKVPLISASIHKFSGQLRCYLPQREEACLRCLWPELNESCLGNCQEVGVLGPLAGFFGTMQAMEALKFFLELPLIPPNSFLSYDLLSHSQKILILKKNQECALCGANPTILSLNSLQPWEVDPYLFPLSSFQLVDIREKTEVEKEPLKSPSLHMPLSAFDENNLDPLKSYLFFCRRGKRSHDLVKNLRARGFEKTYSLSGGLQRLKECHQ